MGTPKEKVVTLEKTIGNSAGAPEAIRVAEIIGIAMDLKNLLN
jgi:hypothetical protein